MTDEKICPIMSRPLIGTGNVYYDLIHFHVVPCQREKCMAWVPECPGDVVCNDGETADKCRRSDCYEYCSLIHPERRVVK